MDIQKEREAFEDWYCKNHTGLKQSDLAKFRTLSGYSFSDSLKINISWEAWQAAKALEAEKLKGCVVVPVWIATDFMLPDEGEAVLFIDKHNVIHDGFLSTDYVDGPYGENGEDFGDNQTLWTSNSNGEELIQSKVKYWMARPDIQVKEPKADTEG